MGSSQSVTDMEAAINNPDADTVVIALPNYLHKQAALAAASEVWSGKTNKNLCPERLQRRLLVKEKMMPDGYFERKNNGKNRTTR